MTRKIPRAIIDVAAEYISSVETHPGIDQLFTYADAPGDSPIGSKPVKTRAWLWRIDKESNDPLSVFAKIIEGYMEKSTFISSNDFIDELTPKFQKDISELLSKYGYTYMTGGTISDKASLTSISLKEAIHGRDMPTIEAEFTRALSHVSEAPRESVSAACNILESTCKVFIADENLQMPAKQDLQSVWKVVREALGMNSKRIEDDDLKRILSGLYSIADGVGALRTHASTAHGAGRNAYKIEPRHARLAINAAHTLVLFILESWDSKFKK